MAKKGFQTELRRWVEKWGKVDPSALPEQALNEFKWLSEYFYDAKKEAEARGWAIAKTKEIWGQWDPRLDQCEVLGISQETGHETLYFRSREFSPVASTEIAATSITFRFKRREFTIKKVFADFFDCAPLNGNAGFRSSNLIEVVDYLFNEHTGVLLSTSKAWRNQPRNAYN